MENDKKTDQLKDKIWEIFKAQDQEFGYGKYYQSLPTLGLEGMRPSDIRIDKYKFSTYLNKEQDVLDLGCNCGFLDISIADLVRSITGIEYNASLVQIGNEVKNYLNKSNINFENYDYETWKRKNKNNYDVIFSFAVHYWFKVKPYEYVRDLSKILNHNGYIFFESQDVEEDKNYINFCKEFIYRGFELVYSGTGKDDKMYERRFFVFRKSSGKCNYLLNRIGYNEKTTEQFIKVE